MGRFGLQRIGVCAGIIVLLSACGGGGDGTTAPPTAPPPVASVVVTLSVSQLFPGSSTGASAELRSATGAVLSGRAITWTSSAAAVATVDQGGAVTAVAPGTTTISATSEGRTGSSTLTVALAPVATVTVAIAQPSVVVGSTTTATAVLRDERGSALTGRAVTYVSSVPTVATVDATGMISAVAPGSTIITASSEGKSGVAALTVLPPPVATVNVSLAQSVLAPGISTTATAVLRDIQGAALTGRAIAWVSSTPTVATVDASGFVTAISPGTSTISATSEGKTGSALLTVQLPAIATITIAGPTTVQPGQSIVLVATLRDAGGAVLTGRTVAWSTSDVGIATVSAAGLVSGVAQGIATITATSEGRTASVQVSVRYPIATVTITGSSRVKVGDAYTYAVVARSADGTVVNRPVTWSTSDIARAAITQSGVLTPLQEGAFRIQVTIDGALWDASYTAYDWQTFSSAGSLFASLDADVMITNQFGTSEYPRLVLSCGGGYFFVWVRVTSFITSSGLVAYSFDGATPVSQMWDELSPDFNTLWKPGSNGAIKAFAQQLAASRLFAFAFTEFRGAAKATTFRVTGLAPRLSPIIAACPSNAIVASEARQGTIAAVLSTGDLASSAVKAARTARGSYAPAAGIGPTIEALEALRVESVQLMLQKR